MKRVMGSHLARYLVLAILTLVAISYYVGATRGCIEYDFTIQWDEEYGAELQQPQTPHWSRDGRLIAFSHNHTVYVAESDGSGLRMVAGKGPGNSDDAGLSPSISTAGSRIVYAVYKHVRWWLPGFEDYQWEIVTSALDGSDRRRLTKGYGDGILNVSPTWSPDGSRIAFVSNSSGLEHNQRGRSGPLAIYTMATDGSDVRRVAAGYKPLWAPDGRRLAFTDEEPDSPKTWYSPMMDKWYSRETFKEVLYTVGIDGSGLARLGEAAGTPSWSPDGSRIAFARSDSETHVAIVTTDPDGANEKTVFESSEVRTAMGITEAVFVVSWSPDGTRIAFTGLQIPWQNRPYSGGEGNAVSIVRADGSGPPRLIDAIWLTPRGISWSPDSSRIAVHIPGNHSAGGALKTMAAVELPGQDEHWYRWEDGEMGRDLIPNPTPALVQTPPSTPTPKPPATSTSSLTRESSSPGTPACAGGSDASCEPRDVSGFGLFSAGSGAAGPEPVAASSVEDVLDRGLHLLGASPAHIIVRGTAGDASVRCAWRGVARTAGQREEAIRFWLGKDADAALPTPAQVEAEFMSYVRGASPRYRDFVAAMFVPIARGGLSTDLLTLACYADYSVAEYILGAGPASISVAYDHVSETRSYELYKRSHAAGEFGPATATPLMTESEYEEAVSRIVADAESLLSGMVEGRESVLFLAPMGAHNAIAVEAWQVVAQWDLQADGQGTVNAVRYGVSERDPESSQTLAKLKSRITAAASSDSHAGKRIANTSGLTQYYRVMGAYGDITPGDNATTTFTPAQPPPVPRCAPGTAVANPGSNRELLQDCETLLAALDALRGTAALNWSASTPIASWEGVTVGGTPKRVRRLQLGEKGLTGVIPAGLGKLDALVRLDLSDNSLGGEIPASLGGLSKLENLNLEYNRLIGEVPTSLGALTGLRQLSLGANQLTGAIPPELGKLTRLTSLDLAENRLSGDPPSELGDLRALQYLSLGSNGLTGPVPSWLSGLSALRSLYLDNNALTGGIPVELGRLSELDVLSLGRNRLTGGIPPELGMLSKLEELSLSHNLLTGSIPESLTGPGMEYLYLSGNALTGCVPAGLEAVPNNDLDRLGLSYCSRAPSFGQSSYTFSVSEDASTGSSVGTVSASAAGEGDTVTYAITAGNGGGKFAIATSTGAITVAGALDHETSSSHTLTVEASDGGGGTATATVTITVTDVNEPPAFASASYTFEVLETATTSASVGAVSASDPDEGDVVTYSITSGNAGGKFAIATSTGAITVAGALDHETASSHTLTVEASDGKGGKATATVTITVTDVKEPPA